MFDHILNWKLLKGSHKFPGPDGGTCITEAAIVAAGFKYNQVNTTNDCPPCFSRVITSYVIKLNDMMPDILRQKLLLPFVMRLAGTADTSKKELERAQYIVHQVIKRILPIAFKAIGDEYNAHCCSETNSFIEAQQVVRDISYAFIPENEHDRRTRRACKLACISAHSIACQAAGDAARTNGRIADGVILATNVVWAVWQAILAKEEPMNQRQYSADNMFITTVEILDEAIKLGKENEDLEIAVVVDRMETIKRQSVMAV